MSIKLRRQPRRGGYWRAAFNARPWGMWIAPNWFMLAAFALLAMYVDPEFWRIGFIVELFYLWIVARNPRFRLAVDASRGINNSPWVKQYQQVFSRLDYDSRRQQEQLENRCSEIVQQLTRSGESAEQQASGLTQLCWLHLQLLDAHQDVQRVSYSGRRERESLMNEQARLEARLQQAPSEDLQRSLNQQLEVIRTRIAAHQKAEHREELIDAELARIRQQVALVHEQALLATDASGIAGSVDVLTASLNEANRWLEDQRELFRTAFAPIDHPPPEDFFGVKTTQSRRGGKLSESS